LNKQLTFPLSKNQHYKIFSDLQKKIIETPEGYTMGSTALVCIFYKYQDELFITTLNLGDCRCLFVYNNGKIKVITTDHKPNDKNEKIRIKNLGGKIWKDEENTFRIGELSVSRCFGDHDTEPFISQKPDITIHKVTPNLKFIVLGCDGLYDVIDNNEIPELLKKFKGKNYAVELAKYAINKGTTDNVSVIVIEL
jgi:serine/threonine protein phosphatase PrpC